MSASPPPAAPLVPGLLRCNIGTWGRVWRVVAGGALGLAACGAMLAHPEPATLLFGLGGVFAGSFMIFEGVFSWCLLRSAARAR